MLVTTQDNFPKDALEPKNFLPIEKGEDDQVVAFKDGYLVFIIRQVRGASLTLIRIAVHESNVTFIPNICRTTGGEYKEIHVENCFALSNNCFFSNERMWVTRNTRWELEACGISNSKVVEEVLPIREPKHSLWIWRFRKKRNTV